MLKNLLSELSSDPMERLRWRILREFHVLPGSKVAREVEDSDVLQSGLHLLLDQAKGTPTEDEPASSAGDNPGFEPERFETLKGGAS